MPTAVDDRIEAVRRFNRFYTRRVGMLRPNMYGGGYSLAEVRVLYELRHARGKPTAKALQHTLELDPGYLSRILRGFEAKGYVRKTRSREDGRELHLELTAAGRKAFEPLSRASHEQIGALLAPLPEESQRRVVQGMETIESLLRETPAEKAPFLLRTHRPGDMGWVVERHGALYAQEYGWDETFEALVAEIAARFIRRFDPAWERCWIAEREGRNVGSIFLVKRAPTVAQLRLLIVEPSARGSGIGRRLVTECIEFARSRGYRKIMLWTNGGLDAARHLYEDAGFRLVLEERHRSFGKKLVGQTFELELRPSRSSRRRSVAASDATHQQQHDQDQNDDAEDAARRVTP